MAKTFIVSDDSINVYGTRVLTSGIQVGNFKKNPVMFYNHMEAWRGQKNEVLSIGIWNNLRKEGDSLKAEPEFDMDDDFAAKIAGKVEKGHIRAASIGIRVIEVSEDPKMMLPGQTRPTITKCELREISIVDIPANKNAICLYDQDGNVLNLSDGPGGPLPIIITKSKTEKVETTAFKETALVAAFLGLKEDASVASIQSAIQELKAKADKVTALENQLKAYKAKEEAARKTQAVVLFDKAKEDGRVQETNREHFMNLFEKDFESAKAILESMPKQAKLREIPKENHSKSDGEKYRGKTFKEWEKEDAGVLRELKETDPEAFKALYKASYNTEYVTR